MAANRPARGGGLNVRKGGRKEGINEGGEEGDT